MVQFCIVIARTGQIPQIQIPVKFANIFLPAAILGIITIGILLHQTMQYMDIQTGIQPRKQWNIANNV